MAAGNDRFDNLVRVAVIVLLGLLTTAFWRWADVVDRGVTQLQNGQTVIVERMAKMEGMIARQSEIIDIMQSQIARHEIRPWHDTAGRNLAVQSEGLDRLRDRVDRLENGP